MDIFWNYTILVAATTKASNPIKFEMAVTVNDIPGTKPVDIVIPDISSPRPFIWQSWKIWFFQNFPSRLIITESRFVRTQETQAQSESSSLIRRYEK